MGNQIASLFEEAALCGGVRAQVRLAELAHTPTSLATTLEDRPEEVETLRRALRQVRLEFEDENAAAPPIDEQLIMGTVPGTHRVAAGCALVADRASYISDRALTAQRLTEAATRTLKTERAGVWLLDESKAVLHCLDLYEADRERHTSGQSLAVESAGPYFAAIESESILSAADARRDPRTACLTRHYLAPNGIQSMLDVPIWSSGELAGVLCAEHIGKLHRNWSVADQAFGLLITQVMGMNLSIDSLS